MEKIVKLNDKLKNVEELEDDEIVAVRVKEKGEQVFKVEIEEVPLKHEFIPEEK